MKINRHATAVWNGPGKEGKGTLTTQSTTLSNTQYSFNSRFAEGVGTNPEELIAAAHAGCFCMKLSFVLGAAGFNPDSLEATATVTLEDSGITASHIILKAKVPGISKEVFDASVKDAELNCPVSKVLNAAVTVDATLEN